MARCCISKILAVTRIPSIHRDTVRGTLLKLNSNSKGRARKRSGTTEQRERNGVLKGGIRERRPKQRKRGELNMTLAPGEQFCAGGGGREALQRAMVSLPHPPAAAVQSVGVESRMPGWTRNFRGVRRNKRSNFVDLPVAPSSVLARSLSRSGGGRSVP